MIISELSAKTGVSARSLRYYEQQGLLSPARSTNGYRHYTENAVEVVTAIRAMYDVGFSTSDVRTVLPCATGDTELVDIAEVRSTVVAIQGGIAARIEELSRTRDTLAAFLAETS